MHMPEQSILVRFGDCTYREIRERARADWLAIVPTGCTEQQGPHLPVDFDTWFVEAVTEAAAERAARKFGVGALVLPAVPFGPTPEHRNYGSGYVDIPLDLYDALVASVLRSLAAQGFRRIVVWRGCGGHDLRGVVERLNKEWGKEVRVFLPDLPYHEIWCQIGDPSVPGGHADSFATSICLYLRPGAVRLEEIANVRHPPVDWDDPHLDFARYSASGVIGDPTHASAELGARLWDAVVESVALALSRIAETRC